MRGSQLANGAYAGPWRGGKSVGKFNRESESFPATQQGPIVIPNGSVVPPKLCLDSDLLSAFGVRVSMQPAPTVFWGVNPSILTGLADQWRVRIRKELRRFKRTPVVDVCPRVVVAQRSVIGRIRTGVECMSAFMTRPHRIAK